jgi:hypothetical protein
MIGNNGDETPFGRVSWGLALGEETFVRLPDVGLVPFVSRRPQVARGAPNNAVGRRFQPPPSARVRLGECRGRRKERLERLPQPVGQHLLTHTKILERPAAGARRHADSF